MSSDGVQAEASGSRTVELLRENTLPEVVAFIAAARTEEDGDHVLGPEIAFCQTDPVGLASQYTDFNIRSRHFRIVETFFVERDGSGQVSGLVTTSGMRRDSRVLHMLFVAVHRLPGEDIVDRLRTLFEAVRRQTQVFAAAVLKLRLTFVLDPSLGGPLGAYVARALVDGYERAGMVEEARIANETAPGREAVLLTYYMNGTLGDAGRNGAGTNGDGAP